MMRNTCKNSLLPLRLAGPFSDTCCCTYRNAGQRPREPTYSQPVIRPLLSGIPNVHFWSTRWTPIFAALGMGLAVNTNGALAYPCKPRQNFRSLVDN